MKKLVVIGHSLVLSSFQERYSYLSYILDGKVKITLLPPSYFYEGGRLTYLEKRVSPDYEIIPLKPIFPYKPYFYFLKDLRQVIGEIMPDIVILWEEPFSLQAYIVAKILEEFPATKLFIFSAENVVRSYPWPFSHFLKVSLKRADALLAVNRTSVGIWREKFKGDIFFLPLGVNHVIFKTERDPYRRFRQRLLENSEVSLLFVGRFNEQKNPLTFLEIVKRIKNSRIIMVGDGRLKKRVLKELEQYFKGRYTYFPVLSSFQMPLIYRKADFLLLPAREIAGKKEQFSRVIVEAMGSGVIPIYSSEGEMESFFGKSLSYGKSYEIEKAVSLIEKIMMDDFLQKKIFRECQRLFSQYTYKNIAIEEARILEKFF